MITTKQSCLKEKLGDDKLARRVLSECDENFLFEMYELAFLGKYPKARDFVLTLFLYLDSHGPNIVFCRHTGFQAFWKGKTLEFTMKGQFKGPWIGKGGYYIKNAKDVMKRLGYELKLL